MACTLQDNNAYLGGAIDNEAVLSMGQGGAVYNHLGSSATLQNATLSANAATAGAFEQEIVNLDTTQLHNTIVGAGGSTASGARDVSGSVTSNGNNLFQNAGLTVTGTTTGNIYFQDPKLGPWSDAQGYQDLLAGSPCIDAADPRAAQNRKWTSAAWRVPPARGTTLARWRHVRCSSLPTPMTAGPARARRHYGQ